ncbi:MAG: DNA internalization-related competence protein ComEC/Rec2 [Candidatus Gastranaerophilales bacterium]|nr:DNA internalization-related competence protein ComEC/Rec2 [Candidatus Gastranaerophilales bacterium]
MNKQAKVILFSSLYIIGIIAFFSNYVALFSFVVVATLLYFLIHKKLFSLKLFFVFISIFFIGILNSNLNLKYDDDLVSFADEYATVTAKVLTIPTNSHKDKTKFYAKVSAVETNTVEKTEIEAKTLVTINDSDENFKKIKIGDTLRINGKVKLPQNAQNPSQFDYAKYLQNKKTFSLIYSQNDWEIISKDTDIFDSFLRKLNDTRNNIIEIHAKNIKSPMLEILGGIIFGDDAVNPDESTKETFINSGIFHILAASGMNVTLIFGIWFFFARSLKLNYRFSIITGILLILFYTCMTGFGPPIIRATLMLTLVLVGKLIDREASTISLLFLVAFLMLLINPLMLFDIGFQLSFIVTFSLILTAPLLVFEFKFKPINYVLGACCIPLVAQLFAAPLQMFYFNTFTVYSVLANIAIIPVLSIVSFVGFISSIIALIKPISHQVCYFADIILNPLLVYIVKVADFFSCLPHSITYVQKPMLVQVILYFAIVISIICILREKVNSKKLKLSVVISFVLLVLTFIPIKNKTPEVLFFSVGNADSILLKSPANDYFMIDTGKVGYLNSATQAEYIMLKYFKDKGIKKLKSLIVTHFDSDHSGGTIDILKNLNVEKLYITDIYEDTQLSEKIIKYVKENNVPIIKPENIIEIYNKDNFIVTIIQPIGNQIKSENQKSLVVHCKYKNQNLLFMGDGDIETYKTIPKEYRTNVIVMKSGHHGAKDTVNEEMAKNTELFIISTGKNVYNHPNKQTLETINIANKKYLRTDYSNAIKIEFYDSICIVYSFSSKLNKFIEMDI